MTKAIVFAAALLLGMAAQAADQPAGKGKSAGQKPANTARSGYDIKKGNAAVKKPAKSATNKRNPQGMDPQGTDAQGAARR